MTIYDLNCIVCRFYFVQTNLQWKLHLHILWMATPTKEMKWHYKEQVNTFIYSFRIQLSTRWISSWLISEMPSGPFSSVVPRWHDFMSRLHHFWTFTRRVRQLPNSFHKIKMLIVLWSYLWTQFPFPKNEKTDDFRAALKEEASYHSGSM